MKPSIKAVLDILSKASTPGAVERLNELDDRLKELERVEKERGKVSVRR